MQLAARLPDGATLRQHLQAAAAAGSPADPRLTSKAPDAVAVLWEAFIDLNASRPAGMGVSAFPPSEIAAWQALHGIRLSSWEVETLMQMDRAAIAISTSKK